MNFDKSELGFYASRSELCLVNPLMPALVTSDMCDHDPIMVVALFTVGHFNAITISTPRPVATALAV